MTTPTSLLGTAGKPMLRGVDGLVERGLPVGGGEPVGDVGQ
jgi:hypothetical protein